MRQVLLFFLPLFFIYACTSKELPVAEQESLFTLEYGESERQLNVFSSAVGNPSATKDRVVIHQGAFYISNGNARKVMLFNSYGDLLTLFYDPEGTKQLSSLLPRAPDEDRLATLSAYRIPFQTVEEIAVNSTKELMVVDMLSPQQQIYDEESGSMLNRVITRISSAGEKLDYIGQEGLGGTPFPYIHSLWTTSQDYIVVVTRTMNFWRIYGYKDSGERLYDIVLYLDRLPIIQQDNIVVLNTVVPSRDGAKLYLMLSYYQEDYDPDTNVKYAMSLFASRIYTLDILEQGYTAHIDIPVNIEYEFIGVSDDDHFFIVSLVDVESSELLIMNKSGKVVKRTSLLHTQFLYRSLSVSPEGNLVALLLSETGANIVLWKTALD